MSKVILITGASSGMGKITAKDLIAKGYIVYCAARKVEHMHDLATQGGHIIKMDVTNEADLQKGVDTIIKEQQRIDVLWNNAGYGLYGPVEELPIEKAHHQFDVNLFSLARLTQMVLPHMRTQQSGLIINTSSMGGKMYTPLGAWYHASKHAVEGFSDCLRLELKEHGINVVILEPGLIDTGFNKEVEHNFPMDSRHGPYKKIVNAMIKAPSSKAMKGSSPQVISDTIQTIIEAPHPKTRYMVGKMAKLSIYMRTLLGDRLFDHMIMQQFNVPM